MLAVSQGLFSTGLNQRTGKGSGFLSVLDFDSLLRLLSGFVQSSLHDLQIKINELFKTVEKRALDCEQIVQRRFLRCENVLWDSAHGEFLELGRLVECQAVSNLFVALHKYHFTVFSRRVKHFLLRRNK